MNLAGQDVRRLPHRGTTCILATCILAEEAPNGAVPSVQIKDVPVETHAVLRRRAAAAHQSLQEYLRARLIQEAATPTVAEVMEQAGGRAGGSVSFATAASAVRGDRDCH